MVAVVSGTRREQKLPLPADLDWESPQARSNWQGVRATYVERLADALGSVLARAGSESVASSQLWTSLELLSEEALERFLLAPRVSNHVLWGSRAGSSPEEIISGLSYLARLELDKLGLASTGEVGWVAKGDCHITAGACECQPHIPGLPAVDFLSPHARSIDLVGETWTIDTPRTEIQPSVQHELRQQLEAAGSIVAVPSGDVLDFVNLFTIVLVGQLDPRNPVFSSGTCWQYLGRSVLTNFQPSDVSAEFLAEAIVHESIHGYLYMLEHESAWVLDADLYEPVPVIRSPWSQRLLPVRPYLQACFVWFGVAHFWRKVLSTGAYGPEAERRLNRARNGFLHDSLRCYLREYEASVDSSILTTVDAMQETIARSHSA